jgi:hypothetical protein
MATESPERAQGEPSASAAVDTGPAGDAPQSAPPADGIVALVERWFADHFHGSPIARDNENYSHAFRAKEALKQLLKGHQS